MKHDEVAFPHTNVVNIYILCKTNLCSNFQGADFALENSLLGVATLTKNADPDKYKYSCCGTGFGARGFFSFSDGSGFGKIMIFDNDIWC